MYPTADMSGVSCEPYDRLGYIGLTTGEEEDAVTVDGYSRVSTEEQARSGLRLAGQREATEAARHGRTVDHVTDAGVSGSVAVVARPALGDVLAQRATAVHEVAERAADSGPTGTSLVISAMPGASRSARRARTSSGGAPEAAEGPSPSSPARTSRPAFSATCFAPASVTASGCPSADRADPACFTDQEVARMTTTTVRTHTFLVRWDYETEVWVIEHADRRDVYSQARDLNEARHHAVEVLALVDDIDESEVGPCRFVIDGPVDQP